MTKSAIIASAIAAILILSLCIKEGNLNGRFDSSVKKSDTLLHFIKCVDSVPMTLGGWEGDNNDPTKEIVLNEAGAVGHLSRTYNNIALNQNVSLYFICGPSSKVAIHAPTACYPGSGYKKEGDVINYKIIYTYFNPKTGESMLRSATFATTIFSRGTDRIRVLWAWNNGTGWEAPSYPRGQYGGLIPLNKCYIIASESVEESKTRKLADAPLNNFAKLFLSAVDSTMLPEGSLPGSDAKLIIGEVPRDYVDMTEYPVNQAHSVEVIESNKPADEPYLKLHGALTMPGAGSGSVSGSESGAADSSIQPLPSTPVPDQGVSSSELAPQPETTVAPSTDESLPGLPGLAPQDSSSSPDSLPTLPGL